MSPPTFTRSHELYPTRWCDLFEFTSCPSEGWMLLDLPGAPCDVTQPQMRNMTQRLRKAQECAAAGGKYGLVQAVLLSMDSQPDCPAHWLRQSVAFDACSKVLLPAAHEAQVDLAAARAAYQQLAPAEQRLWCQLQAARIQLKRNSTNTPASTEGYQMDNGCIANVLAGVTGDPSQLAHEEMRRLLFETRWDLVCRLSKRYGLVGDSASGPVTMQAAYNWALAAFHHHGKDHPETKAAVAATKAADPEAWVPQLLAGLSYPPLSMAPASVPGSKMEAAGYVFQFGPLWAAAGGNPMERMLYIMMDGYTTLSPPLQWLLHVRGIDIPTAQQLREVSGLRQLACGDPRLAHQAQDQAIDKVLTIYKARLWPGCRKQFEKLGAAKMLRCVVVYLASFAAFTANLPPISAAPRLWEGFAAAFGPMPLTALAVHLKVLAQGVMPAAVQIINWYKAHTPATAAATAALGFWNPQELQEMALLGPCLCVAGSHWLWQCGDAGRAQQEVALQRGTALFALREALRSGSDFELVPEAVQVHAANGLMPAIVQPIDDLTAFLLQEKERQQPGTGVELVLQAQQATDAQGRVVGAGMLSNAGNPQEQQLYEQFPVWLDQLVSQVMGRGVSLVIEPPAAHSSESASQLACRLCLKEAATGRKQVFGWRQPGDVVYDATYEGLVQAARRRGVTDPDLLRYCAAVEPHPGSAAGSSSSGSRSSSSAMGGTSSPAVAAGPAAHNSSSSRVKPSKPCAQCGELFPKLKQCTRCKSVSYCSKDCQVAHWKAGHKEVCQERPTE